jgi:hypothetical protein
MIVKKFLGAADSSMIAFFGFFFEMDVFVELLFAWERNAIHTLQVVVLGITEPVRRGILHDFESFDNFGAWDVRTRAKIN